MRTRFFPQISTLPGFCFMPTVQHWGQQQDTREYQWLGREQDHTHSTPDLHPGMAKTSLLPKTL